MRAIRSGTSVDPSEQHSENTVRRIPLSLLIGLFGGVVTGLVGTGGSLALTTLQMFNGMSARRAGATTMIAVVPATAVSAVIYAYGPHPAVDLRTAGLAVAGTIVGGLCGGPLVPLVKDRHLDVGVMAILALVGFKSLLVPELHATHTVNGPLVAALVVLGGGISGAIVAAVGVSGGLILVPWLALTAGVDQHVAQGVSLVAMLGSTIPAALVRRRDIAHGIGPVVMAGGAVAGSAIGAVAAAFAPSVVLTMAFGVLTVVAAAKLAFPTVKRRRPTPVEGITSDRSPPPVSCAE